MTLDGSIAVFGIGSTNFRAALATPDGRLTELHVEPTRITELCEQVCDRLEEFRRVADAISAVSISCAGLIDGEVVREIDAPDGSVVEDIRLGPAITDVVDVPVGIENDCTAAALAEWTYGAGRPYSTVVHLTMGTGIGAGVVDHGRVLRGADGHAVEVGLFPIGPADRESCGVPGAWEAYCSGRGIAGYVADLLESESRETRLPDPEDVTARDLFEAARDGDAVANDYLDQICEYNAAGLGAVINAYNPDLVTIGGGVGASNFDAILERTRPRVEDYALPSVPPIERTELGDEIGLYGALAACPAAAERTPQASLLLNAIRSR